MKGKVLGLLALIFLLTGCGNQTVAEVTEPAPVQVSDVDGLLAAIAPGVEIILAQGCYDISTSASYAANSGSDYYTWEEVEGGHELVVRNVENLTIRGCGQGETILKTKPQYADVLVLRGCGNVTVGDLTLGDSESENAGGGVELIACADVSLDTLKITNSGTVGLKLTNCQNVSLTGIQITKCSFHGLLAEQTSGLKVENCVFRDLGGSEYGGGVFWLGQTDNVTVTGCEISDNAVSNLINCYPCQKVMFKGNTFSGNKVQRAVFDVDGGLVFDGNVFDDNLIVNWFTSERATVLDEIGKSWNSEMLEWYYSPPAETAPEGTRNCVHVSTVDELLAAIGPNMEIILDEPFYDLSTASDYGTGYNNYYYWAEEFDGPSLVITDVDNLTIRSAEGNRKDCVISAVPRYAHVLSFSRCSNIRVSGLTAGHTVEPGYCMGGVLFFRDCDNMVVENCGLYGCGILGVQAELSGNLTVKDCDIYECSYGGIQLSEVAGVVIENCTFRDLGGDSMSFYDCKDVSVDGKGISGNARIQ